MSKIKVDQLSFVPSKVHWEVTAPRRPSHYAQVVYDMYRDVDGQWRWRAWARNGKIIANCGEGYKRRADCRKMVDVLRAPGGPLYKGFPLYVQGVLQ